MLSIELLTKVKCQQIVYHKLLQYDITARAFETRSTSYEGPVDPSLTENSPQVSTRCSFVFSHHSRDPGCSGASSTVFL